MLSKSAARTFFLGGTAVCTIAFLLLTADTVAQLKVRSKEQDLTAEVRRGYEIFLHNNCMGCHTLMGEGAYYAPELTKVVSRRGEEWIRTFLRDPEAMYPGRRKMVKYDFFDPAIDPDANKNVDDLLAFFRWVEGIDLNGFPPEPDLAATAPTSASNTDNKALANAPATFTSVCLGCHVFGGTGGTVGPPLDDVAKRYDRDALTRWLKAPEKVKPGTKMPNLGLSDDTINDLVTFLGAKD